MELYTAALMECQSPEAGLDAIRNLIKTARRWPSVAEVLEAYRDANRARRASVPALPEPSAVPPPPEFRDLMGRIGVRWPD